MSEHSMEHIIKENLTGDAQRNALALATFFQTNDISCELSATGYWSDKIYFVCIYNGQSVCYISIMGSICPYFVTIDAKAHGNAHGTCAVGV